MKRFVVRVALEFVAIATAAIVAAQLVKSGPVREEYQGGEETPP